MENTYINNDACIMHTFVDLFMLYEHDATQNCSINNSKNVLWKCISLHQFPMAGQQFWCHPIIKVCHTMINHITISAQTPMAKNHDANKFRQPWLVIHNFWSPVERTRSFTIIEVWIQKPFQQATNEMNYYSLSISYYHTFWVLNM